MKFLWPIFLASMVIGMVWGSVLFLQIDEDRIIREVNDGVRDEFSSSLEYEVKYLKQMLVESEERLGATIPVTVAIFETSLQASITSTDTSMTLVTGADKSGDNLSGYTCFTIDEGTASEEFVCGTAAGTAITSMIRGIDPVDGDLEVTALQKSHRRGASVKITNFPALAVISRILNGDETLPNLLTYATGLAPLANEDLADKEYVDAAALGGSLTQDRVVAAATGGETLADGDLILLNVDDGEWYKATAASSTSLIKLGIAQGTSTDGVAIGGGVLLRGIDNAQSNGTAGALAYASSTAGAITTGSSTVEKVVGQYRTSSEMYFDPEFHYIITFDEREALTGSSGTPSISNKFVTNDDTGESGISIVVRSKGDGQLTASTTPSSTTDAASKAYVDTFIPLVATGTFTANSTATTSIEIGFTPQAIMFFPRMVDDAGAEAMEWCSGVAIGAGASSTCGITTDEIFKVTTGTSETIVGKITTFASTSILSFTETGTGNALVTWLAIGF